MQTCGGAIQTFVQNMTDDVLGTCAQFEEMQIGGERWGQFGLYYMDYSDEISKFVTIKSGMAVNPTCVPLSPCDLFWISNGLLQPSEKYDQ